MKKALIIVDVQNDFCTGGALEVPNANEIIPYINTLVNSGCFSQIILTQDWHPAHHKSFASNNNREIGDIVEINGLAQFMWPDHCVQETFGAAFHKDLDTDKITHIVQKGINPEVDSYSAFQDNGRFMKTDLDGYLKQHDIRRIEIVGLALDYCVKYTCLDAIAQGYTVSLHFNGTKAVNVRPNDARDTVYQLLENGVTILG